MGRPIQQIPQGLLGLLQLKQLGANPAELLETVQPTYDLVQQYLLRSAVGEAALFGGVPQAIGLVTGGHGQISFTLGASLHATVPNGEMWYIHSGGLNLSTNTIAAADTITAALFLGGPGKQGTLLTPFYADVVSARARTWMTPPMTRTPVWALPGDEFFAVVADILTGTSITINLSLLATRLPI